MRNTIEFEQDPKRELLKTIIAFALIIVMAFLSAMLIKIYVTETFTVDGASMENTLFGGVAGNYTDGDRVVVNRFGKVKKGCLVVLRLPQSPHALVKRVIALEGDKIKIVDGILFINDTPQNEDYLREDNKLIFSPSSNMGEIVVPDGHVFVMGDNRNNSSDSREFGPIPLSYIAGKVFMILFERGGLKLI